MKRWGEFCVNLQFYEIVEICEKTAKHWESLVVYEAEALHPTVQSRQTNNKLEILSRSVSNIHATKFARSADNHSKTN